MSRSKALLGGSIVAVVVLSTSVAFAKPLSEQQWKKQGNAVCKQVNKDLDALGNQVFAGLGPHDQPSAEQVQAFVEQFAPIIKGAIASIDALKEPAALKKDVKRFEAAANDAVAQVEANPSVLANDKSDPFAKTNKIARRLGLKVCAED
jgi:hypothetical protein